MPTVTDRPLLDPAVLAAISDLELVARIVVDGTVSGFHRSPFHGYSAEFSQYRHYRPGDDLKYVDWKLFARTDRFYTKQYRETTNMVAQVAVDASASMGFRGQAGVVKIDYARMLAAALLHLISKQGDAAGLVVYDKMVRAYVPSRSGQTHLRALLVALSHMRASGGTAAASSVRRAIDLLRRRGLLVIISDLYDEDDAIERELRRAAGMGHEVAVFHVLTRDEIEFPFDEDIEFEDLETGRTVLAAGEGSGPSYRRRFADFLERWRTRCAGHGIDYTRVTTDVPLEAALRSYLLKRVRRGPR
jgi:uncharacterized protein (DUF58 family)